MIREDQRTMKRVLKKIRKEKLEMITPILQENEKLKDQLAKAKEDSITLRAWQEAFGTTQLTHAIARLEKAEWQLTILTEG